MNSGFRSAVNSNKKVLDGADETSGGERKERVMDPGIFKVKPSVVAFRKKDGGIVQSPTFQLDKNGRWRFNMSFMLTEDVGEYVAGSYFYHGFIFAQPDSAKDELKQNTANLAKKYIRELVGPDEEIKMSDPDWLESMLAVGTEELADGSIKKTSIPKIALNEYRVKYFDDGKGYGFKCDVELWNEERHSGTLQVLKPAEDLTNDTGLSIETGNVEVSDAKVEVAAESAEVISETDSNIDDDLPF